MAKDPVGLICEIGELTGIFEETKDLNSVLDNAVTMIAAHMQAAVCSIYLFKPDLGELELVATRGLDAEALNSVRLSIHEGLTGKALRELRVINVGNAPLHEENKRIEGLQEDQFKSFLAVPILRRLVRIGVLVVQDPVPNYFRSHDERALRAIASQVARIIENADAIMQAHRQDEPVPERPRPSLEKKLVTGRAAAPGLAIGETFVGTSEEYDVLIPVAHDGPNKTVEDFQAAVGRTERQLTQLQLQMEDNLADVASQIFTVQLLFLKDRELLGPIEARIAQGEDPERAVTGVFNDTIQIFEGFKQELHREKKQDLRDLAHRLLANLAGQTESEADYSGQILITTELLPSEIVKYAAQNVAGIIVSRGTVAAHISILARSLQLPVIFVDNRGLLDLADGTPIILDAIQGNVYIDPADEVLRPFEKQKAALVEIAGKQLDIEPETRTADGVRIHLLANINLLSDLEVARRCQAEGVGLYRTEIPFIVRSEFPSEEVQFRIYARIVEKMGGRKTVFRTLDIGGDKILPYHTEFEANPFLGLRAIRFSLRNPMTFSSQVNALLRARAGYVMFPFISSLEEFEEASDMVRKCAAELESSGMPCEMPRLGAMVELPAAVEIVDELAQEADFLSIGTNDLIQYLLAVDRTNENVADYYIPYHPAVLRALKRVVDACLRHGTELSLCGDLAEDERMIPFLIGIGLDQLSMDPRAIPRVQRVVSGLDVSECREVARNLLGMARLEEIRAYIERRETTLQESLTQEA